MDARLPRVASLAALVVLSCASIAFAGGGNYRTQNFIVSAPSPQLAREIGDAAERFRADLAMEWLGRPLPPWGQPCPISAQVEPRLGAGGATSFYFDGGRPFGWTMSIQGSRERVLDSVLPHEITHTIFATHFGRPLPRWADEGACTTVEHASERNTQERLLLEFLTNNRGIPFNRMFAMKDYPKDVLPLYSQGYSLARFLIAQGGKRKFVQYVGDGMNSNNWPATTQQHYGFLDLSELQLTWVEWVRNGGREQEAPLYSPLAPEPHPAAAMVASRTRPGAGRGDRKPGNTPAAFASATNSLATGNSSPLPQVPETARPAAPAATTFASDTRTASGDSDGWYAKQRDRVRMAAHADTSLANNGAAPGSARFTTDPTANPIVTSRPQPPEQPRQIILEWSRNPNTSAPTNVIR